MLKITQRIVGTSLGNEAPADNATDTDQRATNVDEADAQSPPARERGAPAQPSQELRITEATERGEALPGTTYKCKPAVLEHALYITINDWVLNAGTPHETRRPFEIFINSKNMDHFEWIVALTRLISGVFRKGGNVAFVIEELRSVFAPQGGYWKPPSRPGERSIYMNSVVAEIGSIIEQHMVRTGAMAAPERVPQSPASEAPGRNTMSGAKVCEKCHDKSVIRMDGCDTCTSCGHSKCG